MDTQTIKVIEYISTYGCPVTRNMAANKLNIGTKKFDEIINNLLENSIIEKIGDECYHISRKNNQVLYEIIKAHAGIENYDVFDTVEEIMQKENKDMRMIKSHIAECAMCQRLVKPCNA